MSLYLAVANFCWNTNDSQVGLFEPKMEGEVGLMFVLMSVRQMFSSDQTQEKDLVFINY